MSGSRGRDSVTSRLPARRYVRLGYWREGAQRGQSGRVIGTGRVVILNGAPSSGKSSLVDAFCRRRSKSGELWLRIAIDDFNAKIPREFFGALGVEGRHSAQGVRFVPVDSGLRVEAGAEARRIFATYRRTVGTWARLGNDVIVDEVAFDREAALDWSDAIADLAVLWVAVRCDSDVAARRERARGDRLIGLATGMADVVHQHLRYDAEIDTTTATPGECAARLEGLINSFALFQAPEQNSA